MKRLQSALYGELDYQGDDPLVRMQWQLFQTAAISRLRDISLSSTPARFLAQANPAHRFHHSVGVAQLAISVCENNKRPELLFALVAASLLHDSGSPPFSHIAENFQFAVTATSHEALARIEDEDVREVFSEYGIDGGEVLDYILGKESVLAGSLDLDNIDNSLHLLLTFGFDKALPYHPRELARALVYNDGQWKLNSEYAHAVWGWKRAREKLYGLLAEPVQLSSATMLYTALEDAWMNDYLPSDYWQWGEGRALAHLKYHTTRTAHNLLNEASSWQQYPTAYSSVDDYLLSIADLPRERYSLRVSMADSLAIPAEHLCIYIGRSRGSKAIELPWIGEQAEQLGQLFAASSASHARVCVFIHKEHCIKKQAIAEAIMEYALVERTPHHVFF